MSISAMSRVRAWISRAVAIPARFALRLAYRGNARQCPVCAGSFRGFRACGTPAREDAECPGCGALERHRLLWLFLAGKTDLFDGRAKRMLHVAPETWFEARFRRHLGEGYVTADLFNPRAMVQVDIMRMTFPDQSFDVIYCSHVLEHVQDDRAAMREFCRVLKDDGWAILNVPIMAKRTYEDASITSPQDRLRAFGQEDHVRAYGPDYVDRLQECGFTVRKWTIADLANVAEAQRLGLTPPSGEIYFCTKAARQTAAGA